MRWIASMFGVLLVWAPADSVAQPSAADEQSIEADRSSSDDEAEPAPAPSRSIGSPDRGRIRNGVEITSTPHLLVRDGPRGATYGIAELIGLLERAAERVSAEHPGPRLLAGDLSREGGGRLFPHRSHQSGRDADVGFYLLDEQGQPVQATRFVHLRRNGCGWAEGRRYCFDPVRNWALMVALLSDPFVRVQYVLVTPYLRRRLLAEGERQNAPPEVLERVRIVTRPRTGSRAHRAHFHVRIYCPIDHRPECIDEPPYHAWYEGEPSPKAAAVLRRRARARQQAAARRAARSR